MVEFHSQFKIEDRVWRVYTTDQPRGFVDHRPNPDGDYDSLYVGIGEESPGDTDMPNTEPDYGTAQPPRRQGGDDAERRDDGLDAGALTSVTTLFAGTINALIAANAQLVANLGEATKTVVHAGTLERQGLTRSYNAGGVVVTGAESIVAHETGDAIGHEGHQTPLKQSGAETAGVGDS